MRVSKPGRRNQKLVSQMEIDDDKTQPSLPPHDPEYKMQYGCSRKTGYKVGGNYWNPPDFCEKRIIPYGGERWVLVSLCRQCARYKAGTCEARTTTTKVYAEGFQYDEPNNRVVRRQSRPGKSKSLRRS